MVIRHDDIGCVYVFATVIIAMRTHEVGMILIATGERSDTRGKGQLLPTPKGSIIQIHNLDCMKSARI